MQDEGDIQTTPLMRLRGELDELEARLGKLQNFVLTPKFNDLHIDMQMLLSMQVHTMETYRGLLIMRGDMMEREEQAYG